MASTRTSDSRPEPARWRAPLRVRAPKSSAMAVQSSRGIVPSGGGQVSVSPAGTTLEGAGGGLLPQEAAPRKERRESAPRRLREGRGGAGGRRRATGDHGNTSPG